MIFVYFVSKIISSWYHIVYLMAQLAGEPVDLQLVRTGTSGHSAGHHGQRGPANYIWQLDVTLNTAWHQTGTEHGLLDCLRSVWLQAIQCGGDLDHSSIQLSTLRTCRPSPRILQSCILWHVQCNPIKSAGYEPLISVYNLQMYVFLYYDVGVFNFWPTWFNKHFIK